MGEGSPFTLFLSEITPEYFDTIGARRGPEGQQDRSAYLDAAVGDPHRADHVLRDITRVELRLSPERCERLPAVLSALGYATSLDGEAVVCGGPEATLVLVPAIDHLEGLTGLTLSLSEPDPQPGRTLRFGTGSELVLSPRRGRGRNRPLDFHPDRTTS